VAGHVSVARLKSGFRRMIFQDAVDSHACHDFRMGQGVSSIYYKEPPDNNLYFSLLFESKDNAHAFQNKMLNHSTSLFKTMTVEINKTLQTLESFHKVAQYVYIDDYKKSDSTSPDNSLHSLSVPISELPNIDDPLRSLRSLENLALIPRKATVFKCHIAPKAFYKGSCETDPDNILYESHLFHTYFDGDGKRRPRGASLDWGKPPELWIDYLRAEANATVVQGISYHKVFVNIIFRDSEVAESMRGKWKDGTEDYGDNGFTTSFFTTNALRVEKYLKLKKRETRIRWGVKEDMDTPQEATCDEMEVEELQCDVVDVDTIDDE
jgi:hypothetical protein